VINPPFAGVRDLIIAISGISMGAADVIITETGAPTSTPGSTPIRPPRTGAPQTNSGKMGYTVTPIPLESAG